MPDLNTTLHLDMLHEYRRQNSFLRRVRRAFREVVSPTGVYGLQWGDPDNSERQIHIRDHFILPYVNPENVALEIGPGGGRWTRYLLSCRKVYVVDYHAEMLTELRKSCNEPNMQFIVNNGTDFPGIPTKSVDYILTLACFVHLEPHLVDAYLKNMAGILKWGGTAVIGYSDKTKVGAKNNPTFSENTPERMRKMVEEAGFKVVEEDLTTLWNSSVIRFTY